MFILVTNKFDLILFDLSFVGKYCAFSFSNIHPRRHCFDDTAALGQTQCNFADD